MSSDDKSAFSAADMKALRYLALALGVITVVECAIARSTPMLVLVIGLNVLTMLLCPLAIYLLRRRRAAK